MFSVFYDALAHQTKVKDIGDPWVMKAYLVEIIKAASLLVRECIQDCNEQGIIDKDQLLISISRVVWN